MRFLQLALLVLGLCALSAWPASAEFKADVMYQMDFTKPGVAGEYGQVGPEYAAKYAGKKPYDAYQEILNTLPQGQVVCNATKTLDGMHFLLGVLHSERPSIYVYIGNDGATSIHIIESADEADAIIPTMAFGMTHSIVALVSNDTLEENASEEYIMRRLEPTVEYLRTFAGDPM